MFSALLGNIPPFLKHVFINPACVSKNASGFSRKRFLDALAFSGIILCHTIFEDLLTKLLKSQADPRAC
jgi:hypothetical protein